MVEDRTGRENAVAIEFFNSPRRRIVLEEGVLAVAAVSPGLSNFLVSQRTSGAFERQRAKI